jgi:hypothetical protein
MFSPKHRAPCLGAKNRTITSQILGLDQQRFAYIQDQWRSPSWHFDTSKSLRGTRACEGRIEKNFITLLSSKTQVIRIGIRGGFMFEFAPAHLYVKIFKVTASSWLIESPHNLPKDEPAASHDLENV